MRATSLLWLALIGLLHGAPTIISSPEPQRRNFASVLASHGETLFIANPWGDKQDKDFSGVVYFTTSLEAKLTKLEGSKQANSQFGRAIACHGDWLFVSAPAEDRDQADSAQGAVYVFKRQGSSWERQQQILSSPADQAAPGERFGSSLSFDGTTLAVTSKGSTKDRLGAVYLFRLNKDATWQPIQTIAPPELKKGDYFGTCLLIDGPHLFVGCPADKTQGWLNGKVYVFRSKDGSDYQPSQSIYPRMDTGGLKFGSSIALVGDQLAIGQPGFTKAGEKPSTGAVALYQKTDGGTWKFSHRIVNPLPSTVGAFGTSLVSTAKDLYITAPEQSGDQAQTGAIFRYQVESRKLSDLTPPEPRNPKARLGYALTLWDNHWVSNLWNDSHQAIAVPLKP